MVPDVDAFSL